MNAPGEVLDSSAIVPLLVEEPRTRARLGLQREDPDAIVWSSTEVECASAVANLEREGRFDGAAGRSRIAEIVVAVGDVARGRPPTEVVRRLAQRLLRVHPLRAADALQLAATTVAAEQSTASLPLVSLDDRLAEAARREGFAVVELGT